MHRAGHPGVRSSRVHYLPLMLQKSNLRLLDQYSSLTVAASARTSAPSRCHPPDSTPPRLVPRCHPPDARRHHGATHPTRDTTATPRRTAVPPTRLVSPPDAYPSGLRPTPRCHPPNAWSPPRLVPRCHPPDSYPSGLRPTPRCHPPEPGVAICCQPTAYSVQRLTEPDHFTRPAKGYNACPFSDTTVPPTGRVPSVFRTLTMPRQGATHRVTRCHPPRYGDRRWCTAPGTRECGPAGFTACR